MEETRYHGTKQKIFNQSCESRVMILKSWPMMPSFVYISIPGLMFAASMETYELKSLSIFREKANFQKLVLFIDTYLPFLKMLVKSSKSQAKIDFFQN